jgi:sensor histidine kinase YesM
MKGLESDHKIVPLLLLPLVENAFKHGTSEQVGQAWINIDLQIKNNLLKFKISNSKPEEPAKDKRRKDDSSIGLANVRKRLEILYPSAHQLRILEEEDIFAVIMEINLDKRLQIGPV